MLASTRTLLRHLVPTSFRQSLMPMRHAIMERTLVRRLARDEPQTEPGELVVSGLLSMSKGVSRAAQLSIEGLRAAGWTVIAHDIEPVLKAGPGSGATLPFTRPGGVWLAHMNAPEALAAFASLSPMAWRGRRRIGYWAYELPVAPPQWGRVARAFHAVWAPSRFASQAFEAAGANAVVTVPHPVHLSAAPSGESRARWADLGGSGGPVILAMGEVGSSLTRKNLEGAVEIYARAFPHSQSSGPHLVLKVQMDGWSDRTTSDLRALARGRADIRILTDRMSHEETQGLIASCDILLSPHRSEGFGLVLAEAMLLGVPALATGWSGNLDFMAGLDSLLIPSRPTPVQDPSGVYRAAGQMWADPDPDTGAQRLRALVEAPELRRSLADAGRQRVLAMADAWTRHALIAAGLGAFASTTGAAP